MKRIGPQSPGRSRPYAARLALAFILAFYAAGLALATLYVLGISPADLRR